MLRSRWRVTPPPRTLYARAAAYSANAAEQLAPRPAPSAQTQPTSGPRVNAREPEPFGEAYGAGPSRLPYSPRPPASAAFEQTGTSASPRNDAALRREKTWRLRERLRLCPRGRYKDHLDFVDYLQVDLGTLSRLDKHVILHHLLRKQKGRMAVQICHLFLDGLQPGQQAFALGTLRVLSQSKVHRTRPRDRREHHPEPLAPGEKHPQPSIEEQAPRRLNKALRAQLDLLERLASMRHPRPVELYHLLITLCVADQRPDEAAKVYVRLVEDWILEGRIAEGAEHHDFHRGGAPAEFRSPRVRTSAKHDMWFAGVRTIRLPGEVLSLHERLDLWHPQNDAADERLRGFPMPVPTSPPSLVPPPSIKLLVPILDGIVKDPNTASPAEYAAGMRALAMLANPVLSRTLPIPAIPRLLKTFSDSHTIPTVYPENITEEVLASIPLDRRWAFTANTQVHVALVSLMFYPPNYSHIAELERKYGTDETLPLPQSGPEIYTLPPLGWRSCYLLVAYATRKLLRPTFVVSLLKYMSDTFRDIQPSVMNMVFRSATKVRAAPLAEAADDALFGNSPLARDPAVQPTQTSHGDTTTPVKFEFDAVTPDEFSLTALIAHLAATSQFERLKQLAYTIIPFLSVSRSTPEEEVFRIAEQTGSKVSARSLRLRPSDLNPVVFGALINAIVKAGDTGLAQRVFWLAETCARDPRKPTAGPDDHVRLPIHIFTSMIRAYGAEARHMPNPTTERVGWQVPDRLAHLSRREAGEAMAWATYRQGRDQWRKWASDVADVDVEYRPDERFFNATIRALRHRWELLKRGSAGGDTALTPLGHEANGELMTFIHDIHDAGLTPPPGLVARSQGQPAAPKDLYFVVQRQSVAPRPVAAKAVRPAQRALVRGTGTQSPRQRENEDAGWDESGAWTGREVGRGTGA